MSGERGGLHGMGKRWGHLEQGFQRYLNSVVPSLLHLETQLGNSIRADGTSSQCTSLKLLPESGGIP